MARLWEATRGNVLFLRELCRDALDAGALTSAGTGCGPGHRRRSPGRASHDLVAARIGALTPAERQVAGLLALGEPLPVRLLDWLSDAEVVDGLRDRGLVSAERVDGRPARPARPPALRRRRAGRLGPLRDGRPLRHPGPGHAGRGRDPCRGRLDPARLDPDERLRLAVWSISGTVDADPALLAAAAADARGPRRTGSGRAPGPRRAGPVPLDRHRPPAGAGAPALPGQLRRRPHTRRGPGRARTTRRGRGRTRPAGGHRPRRHRPRPAWRRRGWPPSGCVRRPSARRRPSRGRREPAIVEPEARDLVRGRAGRHPQPPRRARRGGPHGVRAARARRRPPPGSGRWRRRPSG